MQETRNPLFIAALAVITVWLSFPLLTPVHVEGFSASIVSIALHMTAGDAAAYDRLYPFNGELFAFSRLGTNVSVAFFSGALGITGEAALRLVMSVGLACLVVGSLVLVRLWTGANLLLSVVGLILLPGVLESAFFYNDNVLSAGLSIAALAIVASSTGMVGAVAGGLLFGFGILARADAVLLSPAIAIAVFGRCGLVPRSVWILLAFGIGAALILFLSWILYGILIFDVLRMAAYATALWDRGWSVIRHAHRALHFVGIPGAVLIAVGLAQMVRRGERLSILLLAGVPILFNLVYAGKMWEVRQLLPLTPFAAALAVRGLQYLFSAAESSARSRLRIIFLSLTVLIVLAPPVSATLNEGPRSYFGRIWSPLLWLEWQQAVRRDFDWMHRFVDHVGSGTNVVVTFNWNADRYLHLTLQEDGYAPVPADGTLPACSQGTEWFARDDRRILHVRLHLPMLREANSLLAAMYDAYLAPCLASLPKATVHLAAPEAAIRSLFPGHAPEIASTADEPINRRFPWLKRPKYQHHAAIELDDERLIKLRTVFEAESRSIGDPLTVPRMRALNVQQAKQLLSSQLNRTTADLNPS